MIDSIWEIQYSDSGSKPSVVIPRQSPPSSSIPVGVIRENQYDSHTFLLVKDPFGRDRVQGEGRHVFKALGLTIFGDSIRSTAKGEWDESIRDEKEIHGRTHAVGQGV